MTMPSWDQFKAATDNKSLFQRARGSNIAHIDLALQNWYAEASRAGARRKVELLSALLSACSKWLKLKMGPTTETLRLKRRVAIHALAEAALDELQALAAPADRVAFDRRKFAVLSGARRVQPGMHPLRALSRGYAHERSLYLKGGKQEALSGTKVHNHLSYATEGIAPFDNVAFANKEFDQLTETEFRHMAQLARQANMKYQVEFTRKAGRTAYWAIPGPQGRFFDVNDKPINAPEAGGWIWAMDEYGNLFLRSGREAEGREILLNHSSFNAGKPVICAGSIVVEDGLLRKIDNSSGHYKPTRSDLLAALQCLLDDGADLGKASAWVFEYPNGKMVQHRYRSALAFLRSPQGPADQVV